MTASAFLRTHRARFSAKKSARSHVAHVQFVATLFHDFSCGLTLAEQFLVLPLKMHGLATDDDIEHADIMNIYRLQRFPKYI